MALSTLLETATGNPISSIVSFLAGYISCVCTYRILFHPLSRVPGPRVAACTSLWLAYHAYIGDEATVIYELHKKYGPVLRIGPEDVDIAEGDAIETVYLDRGGFQKSRPYTKFDIDGHPTIFSTLTMDERANRAKAVVPLFSTTSIRNSNQVLCGVIDEFVSRLQKEAATGQPVNVLNLTRSMAVDAVSSYLFQQNYGGIAEGASEMSASQFVDAYVGVGAFFYFPEPIAGLAMRIFDMLTSNEHTAKSFQVVDNFVHKLVASTTPGSGSYPSRLLERSIGEQQTRVECKDLIFAGSDSTGMNMATILWYLSRNPEIYDRLKQEVLQKKHNDEDPTAGPYLRGVVREALRLSWANPTRLPRLVPEGGWTYKEFHFPCGTNVGVSAWQVHQEEDIFPEPREFRPERWLNPSNKMLRNFFAFGKGNRTCIAQNLALTELMLATQKIAETDALRGAKAVQDKIEIYEWFNSRVKGEKIELIWGKT
ncbi:hypothetical protein DTO021D3_5870 [Paecilomyces variotii]|nr:hypothetical protein DTO032I3_4987 [Paecilomyces variotii]KAJ9277183.1 hypothetical protein DTO021D3_5870 [Paecilomyces variotii]KAJ9339430.1 hypothetical protein DTO027B6_7998 [Paecilomyces variotii]KAJ9377649.1 hypothetical protein DTO032I4_8003 [Paecilomyces variotii]